MDADEEDKKSEFGSEMVQFFVLLLKWVNFQHQDTKVKKCESVQFWCATGDWWFKKFSFPAGGIFNCQRATFFYVEERTRQKNKSVQK